MDTVVIEGLHTCKPGNTPSVNQIKTFLVTEETSQRTGNKWIKIRSAGPDKGGRHYKILSVRPTGTSDSHGNVSFNLEIEETQVIAPPPVPAPNGAPAFVNNPVASPATVSATPTQPRAFDTVEQHVMRAANLYNLCLEKVDTVIRERMRARNIDLHEHPAWFQAIVTTLFLNAKDQGYISHMNDREDKAKSAKPEPY